MFESVNKENQSTRQQGYAAEQSLQRFLVEKQGWQFLVANYYSRGRLRGEIDLIFFDSDQQELVLLEVKSHGIMNADFRGLQKLSPEEFQRRFGTEIIENLISKITEIKINRILNAGKQFLQQNPVWQKYSLRIDLALVVENYLVIYRDLMTWF